ncbi:MAG: ParB/RepB/Spo0J family partition protein [Bacilli bacterium]
MSLYESFKEETNDSEIKMLALDEIKVNENNFFDITEIENLRESILEDGLFHNIVVNRLGDNSYELISGERRYTAYKSLYDSGKKDFAKIPARVMKVDKNNELLALVSANSTTRELTNYERLSSFNILFYVYSDQYGKGKTETMELVGNKLNISLTQAKKYKKIVDSKDVMEYASNNPNVKITELYNRATSKLKISKVEVSKQEKFTNALLSIKKQIDKNGGSLEYNDTLIHEIDKYLLEYAPHVIEEM